MLRGSENWARTPPAALLVEPEAGVVALDQHHLADPGLGQVEGDAGPHHAAADHDHAGPPGEAAPGHSATRVPAPWRPARSTIAQAAAASCTPRPRLL